MTLVYYSALKAWPHVLKEKTEEIGFLWAHFFAYITFTSVFIFFPIGGFLGDVYLGRYKAVVLSLSTTAVSLIATIIGALILFFENKYMSAPAIIVLSISLVAFVVGTSLFNSNILQFGLDQLMEKPSDSLGVFVHWLVWATILGAVVPHFLFALSYCSSSTTRTVFHYMIYAMPACFLIVLTVMLIVAYCTRHHFNRDRVKYNPYKMIFKVLNFARKNKYPVGPVSAFAHCYDYQPSRLDYAKERYGGPFTTSDVEDVKAFKNVFLVLLAVGPVSVLDATASSFLYGIFSKHTGGSVTFGISKETCENGVDLTFSGIAMLIGMPVYMWIIYSMFRNKRPKILHRLAVGVIIYILAVISILVVDLMGHILLYTQHNQTKIMCLFVQIEMNSTQTLELPWVTVAVPKFLASTGYHLTLATSFEFISAQSPHTMKGVLVGSFFAILGVFRAFGTLLLIPFSLEGIWGYGYLGQHPPVVSCGFGYYLVCITVAMIGFILFIIAVKRYKYRRRDEEPYSQACVEEIFARRIAGDLQHRDRKRYEILPGSNEY